MMTSDQTGYEADRVAVVEYLRKHDEWVAELQHKHDVLTTQISRARADSLAIAILAGERPRSQMTVATIGRIEQLYTVPEIHSAVPRPEFRRMLRWYLDMAVEDDAP